MDVSGFGLLMAAGRLLVILGKGTDASPVQGSSGLCKSGSAMLH